MSSLNRVFLVLLVCCLGACAATEPRMVSNDEQLEQEAQRNDSLAKVAEQNGTAQAAEGYRKKAAELRASKKSQPSLGEAAAGSAIDAFLSFFTNSLERRASK